MFLLGVYSLLVDTTTTETRTRRMIVMDAIIYVGKAIGTQIGVAIKLTYGWIPLFSCGLSLNLINMAYIFLVVRDEKIIISEDNTSVDMGGAKPILTGCKS